MIPLNLASLQKALKKKEYEADLQTETKQIYTILKHERREFPLFLRIYDDENLLQMLAFFPCEIKEDCIGDVGRLLHLFNKELDIPGFGMDEMSSVVFFRCMLPAKEKKVDEELFYAFLSTTDVACKTFSPTIEAVASGMITFEDILKKAKETMTEGSE